MKPILRKKLIKFLKIFGKIMAVLLLIFVLLVLFIRSPWGQGIIVDKAVNYVSGKTDTEVAVERLFITFDGNIFLDGLYLEDKKGDTLIYSRYLEADIPIWPIISSQVINIDEIEWSGVRARIIQEDSVSGFNYQFLIDTFAAPDTTNTSSNETNPVNLNLGLFNLSEFDITYADSVSGMDAHVRFGKLELEMERTDLNNMIFEADGFELKDAFLTYKQIKPIPVSDTKNVAPLPKFVINDLDLNNVQADYESLPDGLKALIKIQDFKIEDADLDLQENKVRVALLDLTRSDFDIRISENAGKKEQSKEGKTEPQRFSWPEWSVLVEKILLENNRFKYTVNDAQSKVGTFNPDALDITGINLEVESLSLADKNANLSVKTFSFQESSGLNLERLNFKASVTDAVTKLEELRLKLNQNELEGNMQLDYQKLASFIEKPESGKLNLDLSVLAIDLNDLFLFQPDLKNNEYLKTLSKDRIKGKLKANGQLDDITIPATHFNWNNTQLSFGGSLKNATNPDALSYDLPDFSIQTGSSDIYLFLDKDQLGVELPYSVIFKGDLQGTTESINTISKIQTSKGNIFFNVDAAFGDVITFDAAVRVVELELGEILQNESLGVLDMSLKTNGKGTTLNDLNAKIQATVDTLNYKTYRIEGLALQGSIDDGVGNLSSAYKDDNLNAKLDAYIELDSVSPKARINLDIIGANLQQLGVASRDIRGAVKVEVTFEGNEDSFDMTADITDGVAVYDNKAYQLGNLGMNAYVRPDTTSVDIRNKILSLNLQSNASPADFTAALQRHIESYLTTESRTDTITNPVNLKIRGSVNEAPILNEVLLADLREMDTIDIAVDFNEKKRRLKASVDLPYINYGGNTIDSLAFNMDSDADHLNFQLGLNAINAGPLAIKHTEFDGRVANNELLLDFTSIHEGKKLVHIQSEVFREDDQLKIHINPDELILNKNNWNIQPDNRIVLANKGTFFKNFVLSRINQELTVSNSLPGIEEEHLGVTFKEFKIASILSYLNPEENLARGRMNGEFIVENPFSNPGMLADFRINDFYVLDVDMGQLTFEGESVGKNDYAFDLSIKEGKADLDLTGSYVVNEKAAQVDLNLDINAIQMEAIQAFAQGEIQNSSGFIAGNIQVTGTAVAPQYEGKLTFKETQFEVTKLNAQFTLPEESVKVDNAGVYFDQFIIQDANKNTFTVNGNIGTESFINPSFDLRLKAKNFRALNSTKEDFDLFYGTAVFDLDAKITGDLDLPKVDLTLEVGSKTDVTYVIPPSQAQIESRQGVVIFVNKENPDAILTQSQEESYTLSGFDIKALLRIKKDAVFNIILDESTGDNFRVTGSGDLRFNMNPNGRMTLTGRYNIDDGHYEMSLYNLVKRRFELAKDSRITWSGDPLDATLDVRAFYEVEASASALMAAQTSGADVSTRNRFRQELPFLVYINITGEMLQPRIDFSLDLPEDSRGAVGGQIYGRIQQLNNQENELNKQVFSLLVLNRFFPDSGSAGASGGTATIARDNLNDAVEDQLNMFSDKLLGDTGFELDFGLDSFTDYQGGAPQQRTTLDIAAQKKLLDDRLIVRVGSEVDIEGSQSNQQGSDPLIGDVSLEYLLTEDGRFRIRGFRRNQFENVIDGQLIVSGISLIFTREFNKFDELWRSLLNAKQEDEEEE